MINSSKEILKIEKLRMKYINQSEWILNGINLQINQGDKFALIGKSGCGKSTLARTILQLFPCKAICEGEIFVAGQSSKSISKAALRKIRGESVGFVFQDPMTRLNPLMTIGDHLLDTLNCQRADKSENWKRHRAYDLLNLVGINSSRFNSYPHEFSGGMRQRIGIALAISLNPKLIIADELTTSLDVHIANQIMSVLNDLCDEFGTSLLLITHDLAMASKWCERMAILDSGVIVEESTSENIIRNPQSLPGKKLIAACRAKEKNTKKFSQSLELALEVQNLRCWYASPTFLWKSKWFKAVDDISFELMKGEMLGIVGASGCGKSSLCRAIVGLTPIRGGEIKINGKNLFDSSGLFFHKNRKMIQMVFQDPQACFNPNMSIFDAIADPLRIHNLIQKKDIVGEIKNLLIQVGLPQSDDFMQKYPFQLSGGQQQRVAIARALALKPKVLICDESISMLDIQVQVEILNLLKSLQKQLRLAILFITHDLLVAKSFCDRILVMHNGKIVEQGLSQNIFSHPLNKETKKLLNASPKLML